jgi:hypothetical protein
MHKLEKITKKEKSKVLYFKIQHKSECLLINSIAKSEKMQFLKPKKG